MKLISLRLSASAIITRIFISILALSAPAFAQQPLREAFQYDNFEIREEMVPMRDGVKLYTLILTPKNSTEPPLPILIKRTPYDATGALSGHSSSRLDVTLGSKFLGDDYIYVFQDIRGRFKSEGDYAMYRVPRGEFNKTVTDETTDAWDTSIGWFRTWRPTVASASGARPIPAG